MDRLKTFSERLRELLDIKGLTKTEIAAIAKVNKSNITRYLNGEYEAKQDVLFNIGTSLNVNEAWLMGYDVPMERPKQVSQNNIQNIDNIFPISTKRFPLLGEIACGKPVFADENRDSYVQAGTDINADFCLKCKGDSMINARIYDGDIVFVKRQDMVENGEIAVIIINDEATLKRVYYYPENAKLVLQAENPLYEPFIYVGTELNSIRILGKAVAFQSDIR